MNKRIRKKQLKKIGKYVPYKDTWSLDITIAEFILPRLKLFKKVVDCHPHDLNSMKEWHDILDKMIEAFYLIINRFSELLDVQEIRVREEKISYGLDLFRKYYNHLWW